MKDITSTITKPLAVLGENGKGITLTEDEGRNLYAALKVIYEKE